jgi:hypothetical protein
MIRTKKTRPTKAAPIGDAAVQAKTGKTWFDWFAILEAAGAPVMSHKQIVAYLRGKHDIAPWWQQMVTVTYEQSRGLRDKHQKADGYAISRGRTLNHSVAAVYRANLPTPTQPRARRHSGPGP